MSRYTGRSPLPADIEPRIPRLRVRLAASVSGFVLVRRFGVPDRSALALMIERGEAEIFKSPLGPAYRLVEKGDQDVE